VGKVKRSRSSDRQSPLNRRCQAFSLRIAMEFHSTQAARPRGDHIARSEVGMRFQIVETYKNLNLQAPTKVKGGASFRLPKRLQPLSTSLTTFSFRVPSLLAGYGYVSPWFDMNCHRNETRYFARQLLVASAVLKKPRKHFSPARRLWLPKNIGT
jgi:hypothetical protein